MENLDKLANELRQLSNETHEIVGTDYNLLTLKKGNQEPENWLRSLISRNADFEFHTVPMNGKNVGKLYKKIERVSRLTSPIMGQNPVRLLRIF